MISKKSNNSKNKNELSIYLELKVVPENLRKFFHRVSDEHILK